METTTQISQSATTQKHNQPKPKQKTRQRRPNNKNTHTHASLAGDFEETTPELEQWIADYDGKARDAQSEVAELQRGAANRRMEAEALKDQYSRACKRHGRLAAEAEAHAGGVRARDALVRELAARMGLPLHGGSAAASLATTSTATAATGGASAAGAAAPPPPLPPAAVEAFAAELSARAADLGRQLAEMRASHHRQDEALTADVDRANAALGRAAEARRMQQEQQASLQARADALAAEAAALAVDADAVADLAGRAEAAKQMLAAKQQELAQV